MSTTNRTFTPGRLVATPGALEAFARNGDAPGYFHLPSRHLASDWGDVCPEDAQANEEALRYGFRLLSSYDLADGTRVWLITEADRSATTALLPEEY